MGLNGLTAFGVGKERRRSLHSISSSDICNHEFRILTVCLFLWGLLGLFSKTVRTLQLYKVLYIGLGTWCFFKTAKDFLKFSRAFSLDQEDVFVSMYPCVCVFVCLCVCACLWWVFSTQKLLNRYKNMVRHASTFVKSLNAPVLVIIKHKYK